MSRLPLMPQKASAIMATLSAEQHNSESDNDPLGVWAAKNSDSDMHPCNNRKVDDCDQQPPLP